MDETKDTIREVREVLERALEEREVFVHLNGEADEVDLPQSLAGSPNVTLKLSYYYRGPLLIEENVIKADLLFPEGAFTCVVPIKHVWGVTQTSGESMFWPEHAPRQVLEAMIRGVSPQNEEETENEETEGHAKTQKTKLHAVSEKESSIKDGEKEKKVPSEKDKDSEKKEEGKKSPPTLKRIK